MFEVAAPEFSLQASLSSGQTFRWTFHEGWYYGFIGRSVLKVRQEGERLLCESSDPAITAESLRRYFSLDLNLPEVLSSINVDMQIHHAIIQHRGLRILRQDGWETLASFICASFNNIKRIEGMIERLCVSFGDPVSLTPPPFSAPLLGVPSRGLSTEGRQTPAFGGLSEKGGGVNGFRGFSFPRPDTMAGVPERRLRSVGLGYRAPYLKATARLVADRKLPLEQLRTVDYDAAKRALLGCDGVGDKVADCVALFGCEQYQAFPIDVWIERALRYYFRHRKMTRKLAHDYARAHFGPYAGYAQQYLYHYVRNLRLGAQ